jgi:hypothetical protein
MGIGNSRAEKGVGESFSCLLSPSVRIFASGFVFPPFG